MIKSLNKQFDVLVVSPDSSANVHQELAKVPLRRKLFEMELPEIYLTQ